MWLIFLYNLAAVSRDGFLHGDINMRFSKDNYYFNQIKSNVWSDKDITIKTIFNVNVLRHFFYESRCAGLGNLPE